MELPENPYIGELCDSKTMAISSAVSVQRQRPAAQVRADNHPCQKKKHGRVTVVPLYQSLKFSTFTNLDQKRVSTFPEKMTIFNSNNTAPTKKFSSYMFVKNSRLHPTRMFLNSPFSLSRTCEEDKSRRYLPTFRRPPRKPARPLFPARSSLPMQQRWHFLFF